jgi:hypothetical protein
MRALRRSTLLLASPAFLLSLLPGLTSMASAADVREEYGRYPIPRPVPRTHLELSDEVQVERRGPPIVQAPDGQCRAFTKRRFNEVGELVIRRIRICEEVVRGPAPAWPGEPPRREDYGRPAPPTTVPPQGSEPEELEEGEPG